MTHEYLLNILKAIHKSQFNTFLLQFNIFILAVNMYRRHESLISQVTKTADDVPVIVTRLASTEKNDIDYYPFSQVLRIRVLQVIFEDLATYQRGVFIWGLI